MVVRDIRGTASGSSADRRASVARAERPGGCRRERTDSRRRRNCRRTIAGTAGAPRGMAARSVSPPGPASHRLEPRRVEPIALGAFQRRRSAASRRPARHRRRGSGPAPPRGCRSGTRVLIAAGKRRSRSTTAALPGRGRSGRRGTRRYSRPGRGEAMSYSIGPASRPAGRRGHGYRRRRRAERPAGARGRSRLSLRLQNLTNEFICASSIR